MAASVAVWGLGFASTNSMQQARLVAAAPALASASVALNTSVLYIGRPLVPASGVCYTPAICCTAPVTSRGLVALALLMVIKQDRTSAQTRSGGYMRITLALVALLYSTAVMAQASPPAAGSPPIASSPPTVGEQPLLQVKPRGHKARAVPASSKSASVAKKLQACLEIDDGTKGRLDCDDAIFPPKPNPKAKPADRVMDCRFIKEEDERLNCYNGFAEKIPKF